MFVSSGMSTLSAYFSREYYYVNKRMNWTEAQRYCREEFDDLATIDNDYNNQRLLTLARESDDDIWIGLYNDINIWKWSGEGKNFYFVAGAKFLTWMKNQPNNKFGNQHCVAYYDSREINDLYCGERHPFICNDGMEKWFLVVIPTFLKEFWPIFIHVFWLSPLSLTFKDNSTTNHVLINQQLTWPEARMYCREHHRDLVSIRNQEENNNILCTLLASRVANAWIGLYRNPWAFWSDKSTSTFTNWNNGEPNNTFVEYCAAFDTLSGKWGDENCGKTVPFFCFKGEVWHTNTLGFYYHVKC